MIKKYFIPIALLALSCSCAQRDNFVIEGRTQGVEYHGQYVYLLDAYDLQHALDSAKVENGKFHFEGAQPAPAMRTLRLQAVGDMFPILLPIVLENEEIEITMGDRVTVEGSKLNDKIQSFLMAISHFTDQDFSTMTTEEMELQFQNLIIDQVLMNKDNMVGTYIYKIYAPKLTEDQRTDLCAKAGTEFAKQ